MKRLLTLLLALGLLGSIGPVMAAEPEQTAPVGVDGAQKIQGVAVALRLPQQAEGAGVLLVVEGQDQLVGEAGGFQKGAGPVQGQAAAVALHHAQGGQELHRAGLQQPGGHRRVHRHAGLL